MPFGLLLAAADPAIGRAGTAFLPDQARMELLIEGFADKVKARYQDADGEFLDVCRWPGVKCDAGGSVSTIELRSLEGTAVLPLEYIPSSITSVVLRGTSSRSAGRLCGSIDAAALPLSLQVFHVANHSLTGTVDFRAFPPELQRILMDLNELTGSCDLTALPPHLSNLTIDSNRFSGGLSFAALPRSLRSLFLHNNLFVGRIDLGALPQRLRTLNLSHNEFEGEFRLSPATAPQETHARGNHFSGTAVVPDSEDIHVDLRENEITAVVDEHGRPNEWYMEHIGLMRRQH